MAVRWRKYFKECKPIACNGRNGKYCPSERPKRQNGTPKDCGVWCIEFFDDRKEWQSLTFKNIHCKTDAEKRLTCLIGFREEARMGSTEAEKRLTRIINRESEEKVKPTLAEYAKTYLDSCKNIPENTRLAKELSLKLWVKHLGSYPLNQVTPSLIDGVKALRREHDGVKEATVNLDIAILSHLFTKAIKDKLVDKNPCQNVERFRVVQTRNRVLSGQEIALLLDRFEGRDRLMVMIGLFTGMRLREVLGLKWSDIDFEERVLVFVPSKTGKLLTLPIPDYLLSELLAYKAICTNDYLFEKSVNHYVVVRYSQRFSQLFKKLGIEGATYHTLRHCFSSLLQGKCRVSPLIAKSLLGHSSLRVTSLYSHSNMESEREAVESLTQFVLNAGKNNVLSIPAQLPRHADMAWQGTA